MSGACPSIVMIRRLVSRLVAPALSPPRIDMYHERRHQAVCSLTEEDLIGDRGMALEVIDGEQGDEPPSIARLLLEECRRVHEEVMRKVKPMRCRFSGGL